MLLTRRHAASPSLDARPPRPWGGRPSRQSPWFAFRASVSSVGLYGRNYSKTMKFKLLYLYAKKINCGWPIKLKLYCSRTKPSWPQAFRYCQDLLG